MEEQKKWRFLRLCCYGLAIVTVLLASQYDRFYETSESEEMAAYCGVVDTYADVEPSVKQGRKLFKIQCASCHKLDKDFIGPLLGGIEERRDSISLHQFIRDEDAFRKTNSEIPLDTSFVHSHKFEFSSEQIDMILEYTNY